MQEQKLIKQYRGETSKTAYTRNRGHEQQWRDKKGSWMFDHEQECLRGVHNIGPDRFEMKVVSKDRDPLRRILREALRIRDVMEGEQIKIMRTTHENIEEEIKVKLQLLNSKREFHLPILGSMKTASIAESM